jgi:hydroxyacylglutathione hydrolase
MKIKQFRYSSDNNLGYLVYGEKTAIAIDGGAAKEILSFLKTNDLTLKYVTNTHNHGDHTPGDKTLIERSGAVFLSNETLLKNRAVELQGMEIRVYHTPGHSSDSVTFHCENFLITGDTLFNGKVGRCFSGDLRGFLNSVKLLMDLPGKTIIYAGHDYVEEYMGFAKELEPDNPHIERYLEKYDPAHVHSTLEEESRINPFLRFNDKKIISALEKRGLPTGTEYERWESLISLM